MPEQKPQPPKDEISDQKIELRLKMEVTYYQASVEQAIDNTAKALKINPERVKPIAERILNKSADNITQQPKDGE